MRGAQVVDVEPDVFGEAVSDQVLVFVLVFAHVEHVVVCGIAGAGREKMAEPLERWPELFARYIVYCILQYIVQREHVQRQLYFELLLLLLCKLIRSLYLCVPVR